MQITPKSPLPSPSKSASTTAPSGPAPTPSRRSWPATGPRPGSSCPNWTPSQATPPPAAGPSPSCSKVNAWSSPPTLAEFKAQLGLETADLAELELAITKNVGAPEIGGISIRLVRKVDENIDALVDTTRYNTAKDPDNLDLGVLDALDEKLSEALSELRLIKDE